MAGEYAEARRALSSRVQVVCEFGSRADGELSIYSGQIGFHGFDGHEEFGGGLLVRAAGRDQFGDAAFRCREGSRRGVQADSAGLVPGSFRPSRYAEFLEGVRRRAERPGRLALVAGAAVDLSQGQLGARRAAVSNAWQRSAATVASGLPADPWRRRMEMAASTSSVAPSCSAASA